jgi:hypothetical protein
MITTNLKRSIAALAVTAGLLVAAAGPASAAIYMKVDGISSSVVAVPAENTGPASKSLNTFGGDDAVKAKREKAKHGKGKVAHGNQRTGAILAADMLTFNQAETLSSN